MALGISGILFFLQARLSMAQMPGKTKVEMPPPVTVAKCTVADGCKLENMWATLDANWRWSHSQTCTGKGANMQCSTAGNCYTGDAWDQQLCKNPKSCAQSCALEGAEAADYTGTYGVSPIPGGLKLNFVSMGAGGMNVGSRLYLMDTEESYKLFKLKNREFTFDVDVSKLPCGLNGAVYFSEMAADGDLGGDNKAGAKYGTGYCDAQCPHDVKFIAGKANVLKWNATATTGSLGACCHEMDIWEANAKDTAYTPHVCEKDGLYVCTGTECGDILTNERYKGVCDKDGCDFNSYRLGEQKFFGEGGSFKVDSTKPVTVVTQWITEDGTDAGELSEIRRLYVQGGKVIKNSHSTILGKKADFHSITDEYCQQEKKMFGDIDDFTKKGGLKKMGKSLERGMVLVMSLWDDKQAHMLWLDSDTANATKYSGAGTVRGPCPRSSGVPEDVRAQSPDSYVTYTNIMYGEIDSTYKVNAAQKPEKADTDYDARVKEWSAGPTPPPQPQAPPVQPGQPQPQQQPSQAAPAAGASGKAAAYQQCSGGPDYNGPTDCEDGCQCVVNFNYGQCTPPSGEYMCKPGDKLWVLQKKHLSTGPNTEANGGNRHTLAMAGSVLCGIATSTVLLAGMAACVKARSRPSLREAYDELHREPLTATPASINTA